MSVTLESAKTGVFAPPPPDRPWAKPLRDHPTQSATAIDGWSSVLFGFPFLAAGIFITLALLDTVRSPKQPPGWVIGIAAGMFLGGGVFFLMHGIGGVMRRNAWRREAAARPNEPWLYDHPWRREGIAFSSFDDMVKRLLAAIVWTTFLLPFAWVGWQGAWPFLVAVAIFGLPALIFWYRWAQLLFDFLRDGPSYLAYDEFPFALGGMLRARLQVPRHVSVIEAMALTLRCVEEKYVTTGRGESRSTNVVCYEIYSESITLNRDRLRGPVGGEISFEFRVPSEQPETTLIATWPTYWEIEAKGRVRGVNYEAVFLVPVYKTS